MSTKIGQGNLWEKSTWNKTQVAPSETRHEDFTPYLHNSAQFDGTSVNAISLTVISVSIFMNLTKALDHYVNMSHNDFHQI